MNIVKRFLKDESGPTAVEYAVMLGLITACLISISSLGGTASQTYDSVSSAVSDGGKGKGKGNGQGNNGNGNGNGGGNGSNGSGNGGGEGK